MTSCFVSWAHAHERFSNTDWTDRVFRFTAILQRLGLSMDIDLVHLHDDDVDWSTYGAQAISKAEYVLLVASSAYRERWDGTGDPTVGAGAAREANALKAIFDEDRVYFQRKVKVVLLPGVGIGDVPRELRSAAQRFDIAELSPEGVTDLLRTLLHQPKWVLPEPGDAPELPPRFVERLAPMEAGRRTRHRREPAAATRTRLQKRLVAVSRRLDTEPDVSRRVELEVEQGALRAAIGTMRETAGQLRAQARADPNRSSARVALHCSFCGKDRRAVKVLVAGPDVYICDECADLTAEIIDEGAASDRAEAVSTVCTIALQLANPHVPHEMRAVLLEQLDSAAARVRPKRRPRPGDTVAGAQLKRVVGAGTFGTVWEATEVDDGQAGPTVAVKVFDPDKVTIGMMLWRFQRGIRAMSHLTELERIAPRSICRIRSVNDDLLSFSMDFYRGGDLSRLPFLRLSETGKRAIFRDVATALAFAHRHGIVHRDVKPANVVLDGSGAAVLTDFDIADLTFAATQSVAAAALGSPHFAAPEQLAGDLVASPTADIFSLGKLLYFVLTESSPPLGATERGSEPRWLRAGIEDPAVRGVIARAIRDYPEARYQCVAEFLEDLPDAFAPTRG